MQERNPENVVSFEKYFPSDILPTTRFISKLPGIDQEYSGWIGKDEVFWNGISTINGEPTTIRILHANQDTTFLLQGERRSELWEMEENTRCTNVKFKRKNAALPGTILSPTNTIQIGDTTHFINLNFCDDRKYTEMGDWCNKCPFQDKKLEEKGTRQVQYGLLGRYHDVTSFRFQRPSDLPIRRIKDINMEKSKEYLKGFQSLDEAISSLITLRDAINSATPLLSEKSAPIPSSQSLTDDNYFK